jgi:hypothetical protein
MLIIMKDVNNIYVFVFLLQFYYPSGDKGGYTEILIQFVPTKIVQLM